MYRYWYQYHHTHLSLSVGRVVKGWAYQIVFDKPPSKSQNHHINHATHAACFTLHDHLLRSSVQRKSILEQRTHYLFAR
jgi:hypothetical protein